MEITIEYVARNSDGRIMRTPIRAVAEAFCDTGEDQDLSLCGLFADGMCENCDGPCNHGI